MKVVVTRAGSTSGEGTTLSRRPRVRLATYRLSADNLYTFGQNTRYINARRRRRYLDVEGEAAGIPNDNRPSWRNILLV